MRHAGRRRLPSKSLLLALCLSHAGLLLACAKSSPSLPALDPIQQLSQDITAATATPGVRRGAWGILVRSIDRDDTLFALNPGTLLVPASALKLVSVATAADAVGWEHRFETTVRATGPVADGILTGDLIVTGSGDPTIGGRSGDDLSTWVDTLKTLGIRRIDGRIVGDDDALQEPRPQLAWTWDDLGYTSGAIFGALNVAENRMVVTLEPGPAPGDPTRMHVEPYAAGRPLLNRSLTGEPGSSPLVWPEQRPGEPFLTIDGSIPAGAEPARLGVSTGNPTDWFASVLRSRLIDAGIEVTGPAVDIDDAIPRPGPASTVLYMYRSHPLSEIVQPLMKDSINLYAEAVLRLNVAPGVFPTNDAALAGMRRRLDGWGIPNDAWQIVDGSGLSRRNAVSPEALVGVLRHMHDPSGASPWMAALPVAGRDGTLAGRMTNTPAEGNLRAKTGTMSNVRSLAGYVTTRDGETLAFAVMADGFEGSGAAAVEAIDRIAVALAGFSRRAASGTPPPR